jgi:hypothetical protein
MGSGRVIIASSRESEKSYTGTPYSIFTTCLMEALAGRASRRKDGFARILNIIMYLFDEVPSRAAGQQHPFVNQMLDVNDNFPLCYYAGGSKDIPDEGQASPSISVTVTIPLIPRKRREWEARMNMLLEEQRILMEKLKRTRKAFQIENNPSVKYQYEQLIEEDETAYTRLGLELDEIDQKLQ